MNHFPSKQIFKFFYNQDKNKGLRIIIALLILALFALIIILSVPRIKIDPAIEKLFPQDKNVQRTYALVARSPVSDKVILYIEPDDMLKLPEILKEVHRLIKESGLVLTNGIPQTDDIQEIFAYAGKSSLLLYPYEMNPNPFTKEEMTKRIKAKEEYLNSMPFYNPAEDFFLDPLFMSKDILLLANTGQTGKYTPQYGGVISKDKKAFIQIFKADFFPQAYDQDRLLYELDKKIDRLALKLNARIFLYGSHLYYWESAKSMIFELSLVFTISTVLTLLIFLFFFRKISLLIYSAVPLIGGLAFTFLLIAVFKKNFGAIPLQFGSTTTGIAVDYTIFYLSMMGCYASLKEVRQKIGLSIFLGFLTTLASFLLLPLSGIISLQEIAIFGILSITFSFLLSWFVLQRLVHPPIYKIEVRTINFPVTGIKALGIWLIIMIFFIISSLFIHFEDNMMNLDQKHITLNKRQKLIQSNFTESTETVFLTFKGKTKEDVLTKSLQALKAVYHQPELLFLTPAVFTPSKAVIQERIEFIKKHLNLNLFKSVLAETIFSEETFDSWINAVNTIEQQDFAELPPYIQKEINSMFVQWEDEEYLMIQINSRDKAKGIESLLKQAGIDFLIIDPMQDSAKGLIMFEKWALILLVLSFIVIFCILVIAYRSPRYSLAAVLPAIAALISCFAVSVLTGKHFNIMHLTACVLLAGIGVDYGVFVAGVYRNGGTVNEINKTFQSIFICALSAIAGFGVLTFCSNQSIFSLGSSMFVGIIFAYLTAYLALPFILQKKHLK